MAAVQRADWVTIGALRDAGASLAQIGAVFQISRERARQILSALEQEPPQPSQRQALAGQVRACAYAWRDGDEERLRTELLALGHEALQLARAPALEI